MESVRHVVTFTDGLVTWPLAVRLNATFETRRGRLTLRQVFHRDREALVLLGSKNQLAEVSDAR